MEFNIEERVEKAEQLFRSGHNCCQSVFMAYSDLFRIDKTLAATISAPLGGGMGRLREVCGTVSGMSLLAGLQYLKDNPSDAANIVGALAASGLSVEEIVNYDKNVEAVSLRDIKQAAQVLLASINVQGILSPMKEGR